MKIALLGSSGWIAHYLAASLQRRIPGAKLVGTYRTRKPVFDFPLFALSNAEHEAIVALLDREEVSTVVNLARGEGEADFALHRRLIEFSNSQGARYHYVSSFNACDAQLLRDHLEEELPAAQSDYGKFKARCELALMESAKRFAIFRFSATHGWAPNRCARTEAFLKKLAAGQKVEVGEGFLQNRTAVTDLADMMAAVISAQGEGVFHLGSVDASEEVSFLRRLALEFGYDESLIVPKAHAPANANMLPGKILKLFGDEFRKNEADAIAAVRGMRGLGEFRAAPRR